MHFFSGCDIILPIETSNENTMKTALIEKTQQLETLLDQALAGTLETASYSVEGLKEKILSQVRWGFFLKVIPDEIDREKARGTLPFIQGREYGLGQVDFAQVFAAEKYIRDLMAETGLPVFGTPVYLQKTKGMVQASLDDVDVDIKECSPSSATVDQFFTYFEPRLTLPELGFVFDVGDYRDIQEWQWDDITAYEEWTWKVMEEIGTRDSYMQVGGWPDFVQSGDSDSYIAQINADIGDCGSAYLTVESDGRVTGHVQMC